MNRCASFAPMILALCITGSASADCPSTFVTCSPPSSIATSDPTHTLTCVNESRVSYDIPMGTIEFFAPGQIIDSRFQSIELHDEFTVHGLPDGTPVALKLRVRYAIDGFAGGGPNGALTYQLEAHGSPPIVGDVWTTRQGGAVQDVFAAHDSLVVVVNRTAGSPIGLEIRANLATGELSFGKADFSFEFVDLPAGTTVTSCNGYAQDAPVSALVRSWGGVKAAYR